MKNPFNKSKRTKFSNDITQKYIEDNNLLDWSNKNPYKS